jgi:hypothetical protein
MEAQQIVDELLKTKGQSEAIEQLKKEIDSLNNEFTIFGYTSEDLRKMKTKKEALKILTDGQ